MNEDVVNKQQKWVNKFMKVKILCIVVNDECLDVSEALLKFYANQLLSLFHSLLSFALWCLS